VVQSGVMPAEDSQVDHDALIALAQGGDAAARERLFALYRSYLIMLARSQVQRRLQGKVDASDLAQDALLEAHKGFASFRGKTSPELAAWLREILAHRLSRSVRHFFETKRRDAALERSLAVELDNASSMMERGLAAADASPSQIAAQQETSLVLADALEALPDDYRQVILLRNFQGLPFADVAEAMGRSVDSVEKLWVRGLGKLRQVVGERHG
jgi:RNA polymerase sigma-70 factor (ECF subfamily)